MGTLAIKMAKRPDGALLKLEGRLDTISAPPAREAFMKVAASYNNIMLDFTKVDYVSSAGLRTLVDIQKQLLKTGGSLTLTHVSPAIMEVFEMTGFRSILSFA